MMANLTSSITHMIGLERTLINSSVDVQDQYVQISGLWNSTQKGSIPEEYDVTGRSLPDPASFYLSAAALALVAVNLVGVGGQVDGEECVQLLKEPLAVGVGMLCRFGVIPAITLGFVELIQPGRNSSIGIFSLTCAPGEGASNLLLLLAEGDLTFSVTLTSVSNFATIAMVPLWTIVFETLLFSKPGLVTIPFKESFIIFCYIITASIAGFLLQRKLKVVYHKLWMYLPGVTIVTLVFIVIVEIYNNRFVFSLITMETLLLSLLVACSGFVFGTVVAFLCRFSKPQILVNCIECGIRTTYITSLLLDASLPSPEADKSKAAPVLSSLLSLMPATVFVILFRLHKHNKGKHFISGPVFVTASDEEVTQCLAGQDPGREEEKETCI